MSIGNLQEAFLSVMPVSMVTSCAQLGDIFSIPTTPTVSLTVLGTRWTLNIIIITWKNNSAVGLVFPLDAIIVTQLAWHLFSWFSASRGRVKPGEMKTFRWENLLGLQWHKKNCLFHNRNEMFGDRGLFSLGQEVVLP